MKITYETLVTVDNEDPVTWHEFLTENEFSSEEESEARRALAENGMFTMGSSIDSMRTIRLVGEDQ